MLDYTVVDVFTDELLLGNPVAVVHGADALTEAQMAATARWTNLSETTFLLEPTAPGADYRLRIFTPSRELPFAGHPTLGSARAWLEAGGVPRGDELVQECGAGLVRVRRDAGDGGGLAFAAPPLLRSGPVAEDDLARITAGLGIGRADVVDAAWTDNGPGWVAVLLRDAAAVLALAPDGPALALAGFEVGVVGPHPPEDRVATGADYEVRAFVPGDGIAEDPVTGSLNAGIGQWLIGSGRAPSAYTAAQGTAVGRRGRVRVEQVGDDVWVGGATVVGVRGRVALGG